MKVSHINIIKKDKSKPWSRSLALCGIDDIRNNAVDPYTFCSLPNDMRCQDCKNVLLELLE